MAKKKRKLRKCRHCGDLFERIEANRGLCFYCWSHKKIRYEYLPVCFKAQPLPAFATEAPPGSDEKIEIMRERLLNREQLFHPDDCPDMSPMTPGSVVPITEREFQEVGYTGIEKTKSGWRVRPFWRGKKIHLGVYKKRKLAIDRVHQFWREQLGLFWPYRDRLKTWVVRNEILIPPKRRLQRKRAGDMLVNPLWTELVEGQS